MGDIELTALAEKLESVFLNILYLKPEERLVFPKMNQLSDIQQLLNSIIPEANCVDVLYTLNTDKQFFGVKVNPIIEATTTLNIVLTDERVKLEKYQVELDSKLFEIDLDESELVAVLLHEISSMMNSYEIVDHVRELIDIEILSSDTVVNIRNSVNYSQLLTYGIKDTLYKISSLMFKTEPGALSDNYLINALDYLEPLVSAQQKITSSLYGIGDTVRSPKVVILQWVFMVYKDMQHNSGIIKDTLRDAKEFTASKLEIAEIDKTINAVDRINATSMVTNESVSLVKDIDRKGFSKVLEGSLFSGIKRRGLKSIEDDYYEYAIRVKNCELEDDAMLILRSINSRLGILEDYLINENISEFERKKYEDLVYKYRDLRELLSKKKLLNTTKRNNPFALNYDDLDLLDRDREE
jgi:hypothetical protein